jgi:hypothetical protein
VFFSGAAIFVSHDLGHDCCCAPFSIVWQSVELNILLILPTHIQQFFFSLAFETFSAATIIFKPEPFRHKIVTNRNSPLNVLNSHVVFWSVYMKKCTWEKSRSLEYLVTHFSQRSCFSEIVLELN